MVIAVRHRDIVAAASPVDAPPHIQCGLEGLRGLTHAELKPLEQVRVERAPQLRPAAAREPLVVSQLMVLWHGGTPPGSQFATAVPTSIDPPSHTEPSPFSRH